MTDIRAGDVVVCITSGVLQCDHDMLHQGLYVKKGRTYRVTGIGPSIGMRTGRACGCVALFLEGGGSGIAPRFRKIDKADEGFSTWMRSLREERQPYRIPASVDGSAKRQDATGGLIGEADDSAVPAKQGDAQ